MDPFRLLARSTGLKPPAPTRRAKDTSHTTSRAPLLGKRKREDASINDPGESCATLKRHKIKVTDLGALQQARSKGSKVQKDRFRLYPTPITSFQQLSHRFNVHPVLTQVLADQGYVDPTEVQMATLPLLLERDESPDLLTVAPTGSGKTLAFMVHLIHKVSQSGHHTGSSVPEHHVTAIVLAPTKELVGQIVNEGRKLCTRTGVKISAVRKGMRIAGSKVLEQNGSEDAKNDELEDQNENAGHRDVKSHILVSTPLSLLHTISAQDEEQVAGLPHVQNLILDEADVLLDQLFREQTLAVWKACTSADLQVSLWSATMGSNIEELATTTIQEHNADSSRGSTRRLLRCVVGLKDSAVSTISHRMVYAATEPGKLLGLRDLLHPPPTSTGNKEVPLRPPFLVFTQTIERATALHSELLYDIPAEAGGRERVAVLHSELSDTKRADVMTRFRNGRIWVLITTDLLSRGVDFRGVNGVVNYDIPTTTAAYVHRAGRTGRAGRQGGIAVTLFTKDDIKYVKSIANVIVASERAKRGNLDTVEGVEKWMLDALPDISKKDKKELKQRGVQSRRGVRQGDDEKAVKAKRKARIGTKSGYEVRKEKNRQGAIEASMRQQEGDDSDETEWSGF